MDRKASWIKTKQVIALLDNLEKVARPDWADWFRQEWPAVLSDIAAAQKEEQEVQLAISAAMEHTAKARQVALHMKAASAAQKKNRLRKQAEEEFARVAAEEAAEREKLRKEKEEQEAAERAAVEAQQARDEAARLQRVKVLRDQELARAQRFQEEAKAIATGEGIALQETDLLAMRPEPEPEPEPAHEDFGRVTFTNSALCGGTTIGASNIPAAPTGRAYGFSDVADHALPLGQPPPPSTPPPQSPPRPHSASHELNEPGSPGYGEEATYQRSRYDAARQKSSQTTSSRLVISPRWALTGGAHGEGQLVNHTSHLGPITSPTRVGGLGAEPRAGGGADRAVSGSDVDAMQRDAGILPEGTARQYVYGVQVRSPDRRDARSAGSPRREYDQPVVEVIGVDGRPREGLSLSPRTDSSALRDAPLDVRSERLSSSSRYHDGGRTSSPSRSSSRLASSVLSVRSPVSTP
jgi:hypothetical protein